MADRKFTAVGAILKLQSGAEISFTYPIASLLEFGNMAVVLLDVPRGEIFNGNVYGVDDTGKVVWQVEPQYPPDRDAAFGGLDRVGTHAVAANYLGLALHLDPATGKVLRKEEQLR